MVEFVNDQELQSKFEMAAKGDSEPYYNFQSKWKYNSIRRF